MMDDTQKGIGLRFAFYITGDPEEFYFKSPIENKLKQQGIASSTQTYNVNDSSSEAVDLESINVVLLFISPLFPRDYFAHQDMQQMVQKQQAEDLCVISIFIRPTFDDLPIAQFPSLPRSERDGVKPFSLWRESNRDFVISSVSADIKEITSNFAHALVIHLSLALDSILIRLGSAHSDEERRLINEQLFSLCKKIMNVDPHAAAKLFFQLGEIASSQEINDDTLAQQCYKYALDLGK